MGRPLTLLADAATLFATWQRVRDGTLPHRRFWHQTRPLRRRVDRRLRQGMRGTDPNTAATCRDLVGCVTALWTFIDVSGVAPTNNAAERAIRPAVLWRKRSFGPHRADGSRFSERMLTVATTLRQQGRNVVDYVTQASIAAFHDQPAPSLLPVTA